MQKTIIFAHRANVEANKENPLLNRPCWLIYFDEQLHEAKDWSVEGRIKSVINFTSPLPFEGKVVMWLETEDKVIWS